MSDATLSSAALIVDDEPEYLRWVAEYLETLGFSTDYAHTLPEALRAIDKRRYGVILVDLEIPAPGASEQLAKARSAAIGKYPGIAAAIHALNSGYRSREVIVYSVHDDDAAGSELRKMDCPYVLKGRAEVLKHILRTLLTRRGRKRRVAPGSPRQVTRSGAAGQRGPRN